MPFPIELVGNVKDSSTGIWTLADVGLYESQLQFIQAEEHFTWLKANRSTFTGHENNPPQYAEFHSAINGIQEMFVRAGLNASATLVNGLDKNSIESLLSNVIAPLERTNLKDYDKSDRRVLFLVENYDERTHQVDGVGVLTIEWSLKIVEMQQYSYKTQLTIKSRSVLYTSREALDADYAEVRKHFG
jgi:hypothetical protein